MHLGNHGGHVKHGSSPVVMPWIHDGQYSKLLPFLVPDVHVQLTRIALLKVESVWHSLLLHLFPYQVFSKCSSNSNIKQFVVLVGEAIFNFANDLPMAKSWCFWVTQLYSSICSVKAVSQWCDLQHGVSPSRNARSNAKVLRCRIFLRHCSSQWRTLCLGNVDPHVSLKDVMDQPVKIFDIPA